MVEINQGSAACVRCVGHVHRVSVASSGDATGALAQPVEGLFKLKDTTANLLPFLDIRVDTLLSK